MTGDVEIGPLRREDVAALAAIHRRAFSGFFLAGLGEPFLREFYRGYLHDASAVAVVARTPSGPIGAAVGTTRPRSFYRRLLARRWPAFALAGARAAVADPRVVPRLVRAITYRGDAAPGIDDAPQGALFASLCVDPGIGSRGVGSRLSTAWSAAAAAQGARAAYLTTDRDDNDAVRRHHERHGWRAERDVVTREGRRMTRYVTDLGGAAGGPRPGRAPGPVGDADEEAT